MYSFKTSRRQKGIQQKAEKKRERDERKSLINGNTKYNIINNSR